MNWGDERLPARFWNKVVPEPNTGCWLWTGSLNVGGYGQFRHDERVQPAHRVAFDAAGKARGPGLDLDHLCRMRCCVNPAHLDAVTRRENIMRGDGPRLTRERGEAIERCPAGHEKVDIPAHWNRRGRYCPKCVNQATKRYDERTRA